jgi:hypothetical protein
MPEQAHSQGAGDSLPGFFEPPQKFIKALKRGTHQRFNENFHSDYDSLEHGIQKDAFNCGIFMANTCERALGFHFSRDQW